MKRKYTTPITEILNDVMEDGIMLPASVSGHTDEALSRELWGDDWPDEEPSTTRAWGSAPWEE